MPARTPLFSVASPSHVLAAALGIILLALVGVALVDPSGTRLTPWIGISSLLFIGVYLGSIRLLYLHARHAGSDGPGQPTVEAGTSSARASLLALSTRQVALRYALYAVVVVAAATLLPPLAQRISVATGLQESFVGTLLLAASTSLPEIAVSIAAVRMGAIDLAVGNILGSNLFNILILAVGDMTYTRGVLLRDAANIHMVSVFSTIAMSAIAIIGLTYKVRGKRFFLAWDAALIIGVYLANLMLLLALQVP
jgi:cation:H+ antiporter